MLHFLFYIGQASRQAQPAGQSQVQIHIWKSWPCIHFYENMIILVNMATKQVQTQMSPGPFQFFYSMGTFQWISVHLRGRLIVTDYSGVKSIIDSWWNAEW